jgi:predicted lipoprotein with Yx(FWY)xxD motif
MKPWCRVLCSMLVVSVFGFAVCRAGWIENGVPLTRQWGSFGAGVIVSDGSSGCIVAYKACHEGINRIMAQHVDSLGVKLWGEDGVVICEGQAYEEDPQIASDGSGGAMIVWVDYRSGTVGVYAQHVNGSGAVQWTANGVALCEAGGSRWAARVASDGAGGAIVAWEDHRNGEGDICAQRVSVSGAVQWTADGIYLNAVPGDQEFPQIVSDGAGGAIVAWFDQRSSGGDIYAQRVNAFGVSQWAGDGVPVCTAPGYQYSFRIASDGAGGVMVAWCDSRSGNSDVYGQRVDATGAVQWTTDGVPLCAMTGQQYGSEIASDGAGGAIVVWVDARVSDGDVYAQRVNALGAVQWAPDGVPLCDVAGYQYSLQIDSDGAGGAIVAWEDYRTEDYDIYAQRVDASGGAQWFPGGVSLCTAPGNQDFPRIAPDGNGGAIVEWADFGGENGDIHGQRIGAAGAVQWVVNGVVLVTATADQSDPRVTSDGAGGAIVAWYESRGGDTDIYAQRLHALGTVQWATDGVPLCTATSYQVFHVITSDGAGGAIVAWQDSRDGNNDIYAQRVDASGSVQWVSDGLALSTAAGDQALPRITPDGAGGAIIVWCDFSGAGDIYAQRVSALGSIQWAPGGVALCTAMGEQSSPEIVTDGAGGAIVTWYDYRDGMGDIYAQRVNASGAGEWASDGIPVCAATERQWSPRLTSDNAGGAIVAWNDSRGWNDNDIYVQRVNGSGSVQWTADGVPLCTATADQIVSGIISDAARGAIIAWQDGRSGNDNDIYIQRVDSVGSVQWTADGVPLCTAAADQYSPRITSDGSGGAIATWGDYRSGTNFDVYVQRVDASGAVQWAPNGIPLCVATADQAIPEITSDGSGGAIVAWQDYRCGMTVYAQRIRGSGEIVGTLLQSCSAALEGMSIRITWALSEIDENARFLVSRASASDWKYMELEGAVIVRDRCSFSFTDSDCLPGSTYLYRIECEAKGALRRTVFETDAITVPPLPVTLYQNHPNPFNPQTVIRFYLPEAQEVFLDVYDVAGERVATLAEGNREKGYHDVRWDGRNSSGESCSSGVYFSRLKAGKSTISCKMVIMR